MENKRGFQLVWSTVVVMILAVLLLLFLISFFIFGSGDFMSEIKGYLSYSNVDSVVQGCNVFVSSGKSYDYCCERKVVKYHEDGEKKEGEMSCAEVFDTQIDDNLNEMSCEEVKC